MWLCFLLLGVLISLQAHFVRPEYFAPGFSLFPRWPTQDPYRAALVFIGTMGILTVLKLLGLIAFGAVRTDHRRVGGLFLSVVIEIIISGLLAPTMMWKQSVAVIQILLGRDAGWSAQQRDGTSAPFKATLRKYAGSTLTGFILAAAASAVSLPLFWWMSPVILGLLLAVPLAMLTSSLSRNGDAQPRPSCDPGGRGSPARRDAIGRTGVHIQTFCRTRIFAVARAFDRSHVFNATSRDATTAALSASRRVF